MKIRWQNIIYFVLGGLLISLIALIALELTLRYKYGLGNPILMQKDEEIGYRVQPNQKVTRFGRNIQYNEYSQRSPDIQPDKSEDTLRILMIGDSVLNGGYPIDQQETITALLAQKLSMPKRRVEVLNASSGSWGIGNQLAYLKKFGTFNSDILIVQIGTHDLIQPTSTSEKVGNDVHFPDKRPTTAIDEAWNRYGKRFIAYWLLGNLNIDVRSYFGEGKPSPSLKPKVDLPKNMSYFREIVKVARSQNVPIYVLFTPYRDDLIVDKDEPRFLDVFLKVARSEKVPVINVYDYWSILPDRLCASYYRDSVHLTSLGNKAIADLVFQELCTETENYQFCRR